MKMRLYGLIGYPLKHSFSKRYFAEKFRREGIDARYDLYELQRIDDFPELVKMPGLCGLNVTIPYKESVIPFLNELDEVAEKIGAVNVIKFLRKNNHLWLKGYNSDIIGFEKAIIPFLKTFHDKALLLGTGGAAKAISFVLAAHNIKVTHVSRKPGINKITYNDLNEELMREHKLIINATPLGTYPNLCSCPDIPYEHLTPQHILFDVVYNPPKTLFLKKGEEQGATIINGETMLSGQAEAAWEIWNK